MMKVLPVNIMILETPKMPNQTGLMINVLLVVLMESNHVNLGTPGNLTRLMIFV